MEEGESVVVAVLPVLGEPATAVEPADGTLDDPALGFDDEAFGVIGAFDDLDHQAGHGGGGAILEDRSGIGAVGEQLLRRNGNCPNRVDNNSTPPSRS